VTAFMLDTNICIYLIKKKSAPVLSRIREHAFSEIGISTVTLCELEYGIQKSSQPLRNRIALTEFLAPIDILVFDDKAAWEYGKLRWDLERRGKPIGSMDLLIAAHALSSQCVLVTNNEREFVRVPHLEVQNWAQNRVKS
jgi:tRNA(fMet)-specific endonuclease VapC